MTETAPSSASRTSPVVPISYLGAALANVLFVKALAVALPVAAFGAVIAALALMLAATIPALTLQALAAADATARRARGFEAGFTPRLDRLAAWTIGVALVLAVAFYLAAPLTAALRMPSATFSAAIPLLGATSLLAALSTGTVLGCGRERAFAGLVVAEPVLRAAVTVGLLAAGAGGFGPLLAMLISTTATIVAARQLVPGVTPDPTAERPTTAVERIQQARRPLQRLGRAPSLAALASYGVLVFVDIIAVRLLLDADSAGQYAGIATASRFLLLLPLPLALLLVARVRARMNRREATLPELGRMLAVLAALLLVALLILSWFAGPLLGLFLDEDKFALLAPELPRYAVAASVFAVGQLLLFYGLATGSIALALLPLAAAVMEITLLAENGSTIGNCIAVVQTMALLFVAVLAAVVLVPAVFQRLLAR